MYFGSVKFFKHIILTVVFGWIGVATVLAVFFAVKCHMLAKEAEGGGANDPLTAIEYVEMMNSAGYSSEDILAALQQADPEAFEGFIPDSVPAALPAEIIRETQAPVSGNTPDNTENEQAGSAANESGIAGNTDITALFPELYAEKSPFTSYPSDKTVFLTFDDGPSAGTYDLLYILKKHGIKATFFMSAGKTEQCREQMAAVAEADHAIGVHSFAHDPDTVYSSVESFLTDFYDTYKMIYDAAGVKPQIYRLPQGGDEAVLSEIRAEMDRRGFTEFPANCQSGDRDGIKSWQYIYDTTCQNVAAVNGPVVLHLHDSADDYITVLTAEDIISYLEDESYTFAALDSSVKID